MNKTSTNVALCKELEQHLSDPLEKISLEIQVLYYVSLLVWETISKHSHLNLEVKTACPSLTSILFQKDWMMLMTCFIVTAFENLSMFWDHKRKIKVSPEVTTPRR